MKRGQAMGLRRRAAAVLLAASGSSVLLCGSTPASAQAPDIAAWWYAGNPGSPAPAAAPAPPDVPDGDLLVQGSNGGPALAQAQAQGVPSSAQGYPAPTAQAIAGLRFALPTGSTAGTLTLGIDGQAPPSVSVVACAATAPFQDEQAGPWNHVPAYDCGQTVAGELSSDGKTVTFKGIGTLAQVGELSVVLVPGPLDRVVFAKPSSDALDVQEGAAPPAFGSGVGGPSGGAPPGASGSGFAPAADGGGVPAPTDGGGGSFPSLPSAGDAGPATDSGQSPVVAGSQPGPVAQQGPPSGPSRLAAQPASASEATSISRLVAGIALAAALVGFVLLAGPRTATATAEQPRTVGGVSPPPRRAFALPRRLDDVPRDRGIGRFTSPRTGPSPRL